MSVRRRHIPWIAALAAALLGLAGLFFLRSRDDLDTGEHFPIYVLGGSTALGDPYAPRADVGRIAAALLGNRLRGRPIQVVNLGGKGKPARAALKDAERLARHARPAAGAAVFLYLGNNEFLGFDRRHDLQRQPRRLFDVPVVSAHEKRQVLRRYEQALIQILETLQASGYTVIASTAAVNLRDWEPNRSVLADPQHQAPVEALLQRSRSLEEAGDLEAALAAQLQILEMEPCFAWSCKRAGDLWLRLGDAHQARRLYQRAVDCDGNPYRELSEQNEILRRVCRRRGVPVVDAVERIAAASPEGLAGYDLFWDNCHPKLEGYVLIGQGFAEELCRLLSCGVSLQRPPRHQLQALFGIDAAFQRQILHERGQYCYGAATLIFAPEGRLTRSRYYLEAAAAMGPEDAAITCSLAVLAALEGDVAASLDFWRRAEALDREVARERARNRYVVQIMGRHGVQDVFSHPR